MKRRKVRKYTRKVRGKVVTVRAYERNGKEASQKESSSASTTSSGAGAELEQKLSQKLTQAGYSEDDFAQWMLEKYQKLFFQPDASDTAGVEKYNKNTAPYRKEYEEHRRTQSKQKPLSSPQSLKGETSATPDKPKKEEPKTTDNEEFNRHYEQAKKELVASGKQRRLGTTGVQLEAIRIAQERTKKGTTPTAPTTDNQQRKPKPPKAKVEGGFLQRLEARLARFTEQNGGTYKRRLL